jgi:hypothetical protein
VNGSVPADVVVVVQVGQFVVVGEVVPVVVPTGGVVDVVVVPTGGVVDVVVVPTGGVVVVPVVVVTVPHSAGTLYD